jgi:hypothetical protein
MCYWSVFDDGANFSRPPGTNKDTRFVQSMFGLSAAECNGNWDGLGVVEGREVVVVLVGVKKSLHVTNRAGYERIRQQTRTLCPAGQRLPTNPRHTILLDATEELVSAAHGENWEGRIKKFADRRHLHTKRRQLNGLRKIAFSAAIIAAASSGTVHLHVGSVASRDAKDKLQSNCGGCGEIMAIYADELEFYTNRLIALNNNANGLEDWVGNLTSASGTKCT